VTEPPPVEGAPTNPSRISSAPKSPRTRRAAQTPARRNAARPWT